MKYIAVVVLLLSGCANMNLVTDKALVIEPSTKETVVNGKAIATCKDYFFFTRCFLQLTLHQQQ